MIDHCTGRGQQFVIVDSSRPSVGFHFRTREQSSSQTSIFSTFCRPTTTRHMVQVVKSESAVQLLFCISSFSRVLANVTFTSDRGSGLAT